VCVCVWFCPRHRSALVRACAAAAYLSGRKWLEGCYCCQPASFFSAHLCLSAQAFYPLTMFGYQCRLGLSTVVGPGVWCHWVSSFRRLPYIYAIFESYVSDTRVAHPGRTCGSCVAGFTIANNFETARRLRG